MNVTIAVYRENCEIHCGEGVFSTTGGTQTQNILAHDLHLSVVSVRHQTSEVISVLAHRELSILRDGMRDVHFKLLYANVGIGIATR